MIICSRWINGEREECRPWISSTATKAWCACGIEVNLSERVYLEIRDYLEETKTSVEEAINVVEA